MESVIKWQTGEPKEAGTYIVSVTSDIGEIGITVLNWTNIDRRFFYLSMFPELQVVAWCNIKDIELYKEETE